MEEVVIDEVIERLEEFLRELHSYSDLLGAGGRDPNLQITREEVRQEAAAVQPVVQMTVGLTYLVSGYWGRRQPWLDAFSSGSEGRFSALDAVIQNVNAAIGHLRAREFVRSASGLIAAGRPHEKPKVLIAHDGDSELRDRLEMECWRLGLEPVVVEEQPSLDESIDDKVNRQLGECQFAIVLARSDRGAHQDGLKLPRGNIIDEIGRIRSTLGDRYLVLLEEGLSLPSNLQTGIVYETFSRTNFDRAVVKAFKSLRYHRLI